MEISNEEMQLLRNSAMDLNNARALASQLEKDATFGGMIDPDNPSQINEQTFKDKFCKFWPAVRISFKLAKIFTPPKVDKIIDELIAFGDKVC